MNRKVNINNKYLKVFLLTFLFILFLIISIYLFTKTYRIEDSKINYTEKNIATYSIQLKNNNFYESDILIGDSTKKYISSLIDKVNIAYDYSFASNQKINLSFSYKIKGLLTIKDKGGNRTFFEKEYFLKDGNNLEKNLNESISIDYDFYNEIASAFKSSYGVDTNSLITVSFIVNYDNKISTSSVNIPLSEKAIEIDTDNEINNDQSIILKKEVRINRLLIMPIIIAIILTIYFLRKLIIIIIKIIPPKSKYEKSINKILKEYDRFIIEIHSKPNFSKKEIIKLNEFTELVDVRDNLKVPIMHYNISLYKDYFYIINNNEVYLYEPK